MQIFYLITFQTIVRGSYGGANSTVHRNGPVSVTRSNSLRKESPPQIRRDYLSRLPPPVPEDEVHHGGPHPPPGGPPVYQGHYPYHHPHQHVPHQHLPNRGHVHHSGHRNDARRDASPYGTDRAPPPKGSGPPPFDSVGDHRPHDNSEWDHEQNCHIEVKIAFIHFYL